MIRRSLLASAASLLAFLAFLSFLTGPLARAHIPLEAEGAGDTGADPSALSYAAKVYEQGGATDQPLFDYTMKIESGHSVVTYSELGGGPVVIEDYEIDPMGELKGLRYEQRQLGETGTIEIREGRLVFRYAKQGKPPIQEEEQLETPLVAPGTLARFIDQAWDRLMSGEKLEMRLALIERQETVGIEIKRSPADEKSDEFRVLKIKPASFVISMLFPAILAVLDTKSHRLLSFIGPAPSRVMRNGKWESIKADVRVAAPKK